MRIALLSDIHEDIRNLEKAFKKIDYISPDYIICLGDISGFSKAFYTYEKSRDAHQCLSLLRERKSHIVPGNHDFFACQRIPKESNIFSFPEIL